MDKSKFFDKALEWINKRNVESLKVNLEGYEIPNGFKSSRTNEPVIPDMTFLDRHGNKNYVEIAFKQENFWHELTKWKLLSSMASFKKGKLYLLTPKGHKSYITKQIEEHDVKALIFLI